MGRNTMYLSPIVFSSCCIDCKPPKRNPYCHSECPEYLKERQNREKEIEQYRKEHKGKCDACNMRMVSVEKTKRKNHDRKERKYEE